MALLGAHVSVSGGLEHALERGVDLGCAAIQIFTRNQMQWNAKPLSKEEIKAYHTTWETVAHRFPVLSHCSYLLNLGSPAPEKLEKSRKTFLKELERSEQLGILGVVLHPGSHLEQMSETECLDTIADSLNWAIDQTPGHRVLILLENTAGQGSNVGYRFEHLAHIIDLIKDKNRMGICVDTCHALAAGYDIRTSSGLDQMLSEIDRLMGLERIRAFHLNDSKKPLDSRVDRHEHIGQGYIGDEAFRHLINDPRFTNIPMVLETPGNDGDYKSNLEHLKAMVGTKSG